MIVAIADDKIAYVVDYNSFDDFINDVQRALFIKAKEVRVNKGFVTAYYEEEVVNFKRYRSLREYKVLSLDPDDYKNFVRENCIRCSNYDAIWDYCKACVTKQDIRKDNEKGYVCKCYGKSLLTRIRELLRRL